MDDSERARFENWFFRSHSRTELLDWTARLRFFRFCRAIGGLANDPDLLRCILRVGSEADLVELTSGLGIPLRELPMDAPAPVLGQSYTLAELRKFPTRMEAFPRFQQLGWVTLAAVRCWAWVGSEGLELQLSGAAGDPYEVTEGDVVNATKIEGLLAPFAARVLPPPDGSDRWFRG
jgi:hypothetical protein